jgi:ferredoxin-NADP reductase
MNNLIKILSKDFVTHDVIRIVAEKPASLTYVPGQAADVSIPQPGWEEEKRPFTFTSLPDDSFIQFTIKTYPSHHGVTERLLGLQKGDALLIHDVFGDIRYKGTGIFIAGGAGVTPFISIMKRLEKNNDVANNKLIFANKTRADIIDQERFSKLLGKNFINILSEEKVEGYEHGFVSAELIKKHMDEHTRYFYLCGPDPMMSAVERHFHSLGIDNDFIVKEGF